MYERSFAFFLVNFTQFRDFCHIWLNTTATHSGGGAISRSWTGRESLDQQCSGCRACHIAAVHLNGRQHTHVTTWLCSQHAARSKIQDQRHTTGSTNSIVGTSPPYMLFLYEPAIHFPDYWLTETKLRNKMRHYLKAVDYLPGNLTKVSVRTCTKKPSQLWDAKSMSEHGIPGSHRRQQSYCHPLWKEPSAIVAYIVWFTIQDYDAESFAFRHYVMMDWIEPNKANWEDLLTHDSLLVLEQ